MSEIITGAEQTSDAFAGTSENKITGECLFEKYEAGASINELNELIKNSPADTEAVVDETNVAQAGNTDKETIDVHTSHNSDANENKTQTETSDKDAKRFSQKDLDFIIGKKTSEQARKHSALLDDLAVVLGVDRNKVVEVVRQQRYEQEADRAGIEDKELYAQNKVLERQNNELMAQRNAEEESRQFLNDVEKQRLELIKSIPDFDMGQAVDNEQFVNMLESLYRNPTTKNDALRLAYQAVYFDDYTQKIAATERAKIISSVKSGRERAIEGAQTQKATTVPKVNVSRMSDEQIAEYAERARKGEKISF